MQGHEGGGSEIGTRRIALFIAILAGFMTPFDLSAVNIALPAIGSEFGMDAITLSWVSTAYLLTSAMFLVPVGRLSDIVGRKKVFTIGLSVFTLTSLLLALAPSALAIIVLRSFQGAGAALIFGTAIAILTSVTPPRERGSVIGIYTTAVYVGLSAGPFLGGLLAGYLGWESIFLVNIPIGCFAVALILTRLPGEWADARGEHFDLTGSICYGAGILALMYGFSQLPDPQGAALILAGCCAIVLFVVWETRARSPVLDIRMVLSNRVFAFSNLAALINYSATFAVTFFLSLYLQFNRGFSPQAAGLILIVQPVVMAIVSSTAGRLADQGDPGRIASAGMGLCVVSLLTLAFIGEETPIAVVIGALFVMGLGLGFFTTPNTTAIMGAVGRRAFGLASGMVGTMRLLGQMLSMGIAMIVLAIFVGEVAITPASYPGLLDAIQAAFAIFAVMCLAGIGCSLVRGAMARE